MDTLSRKRPSSSADAGPSQVKKRALVAANGHPSRETPPTNDDSDSNDVPLQSLEVSPLFCWNT